MPADVRLRPYTRHWLIRSHGDKGVSLEGRGSRLPSLDPMSFPTVFVFWRIVNSKLSCGVARCLLTAAIT